MARLFFRRTVPFNCNDALEAEIHSLMIGMALARQHTELPVMVQSDSSTALSCVSDSSLDRSAFGHLVAEIKSLTIDRVFIPQKLHIGPRILLQIAWQGIVALSELRLCGSADVPHVLRNSFRRIVALP
jgi:hypothetical protein